MAPPEEDEIARLQSALDSATRAREALLAGVAHDLRNPLNTFAMSTGLLRDDLEHGDVDPARALGLVARMERAAQRMQHIIEDLVEGGRIEAKKIDLVRKPERLKDVIDDAVAAARPLVAERGASIAPGDVDATLEPVIDRARIVQALVKATAFVLKTTGDGGRVTISASRAADGAELVVLGVNPGDAPTSAPGPEEGRGGLALLIARGLVAAHGGHVDVKIDGGTRVLVTLPTS